MTGFFVVAFTFESVFPLACTGGLCDLSHRGLPGRCRPTFRGHATSGFGPHPFRYIIDGAGAAGGSQSGKMTRPHKRVSWPP
jgi:hypothetical protein